MLVNLKTAVSGLDGAWSAGIRDLPEKLAAEMIAGGFAEAVKVPAPPAEPATAKPRKGKEKK